MNFDINQEVVLEMIDSVEGSKIKVTIVPTDGAEPVSAELDHDDAKYMKRVFGNLFGLMG